MRLIIFGAKSIALGAYYAIKELYKECDIICFAVTSKKGNPDTLAGMPVCEIASIDEKQATVLVATPENVHAPIVQTLKSLGFMNYKCLDSVREAALMERYFTELGMFSSLHSLDVAGRAKSGDKALEVYMAKFYKDQPLQTAYEQPEWIVPIQVGAALTDVRVTDVLDCDGDNISEKNVNYSELTALYWMWKNRLKENGAEVQRADYYGLFHYRRILDIADEDIERLYANDIDVVLPFPMLHEPDIREHHTRFLKESDWQAMMQALQELQPEYAGAYEDIFSNPYMYNYNMMIAKRNVIKAYCEWLFPILQRTEELSSPKGWERQDRYIGYMGENLTTLYFMYHRDKLRIAHTGRLMLT